MQKKVTAMLWCLPKNGQLVFRPMERFATAALETQIVGLMIGLRKLPRLKSGRVRQVQVAMSAEDARALGHELLEAAEARKPCRNRPRSINRSRRRRVLPNLAARHGFVAELATQSVVPLPSASTRN